MIIDHDKVMEAKEILIDIRIDLDGRNVAAGGL